MFWVVHFFWLPYLHFRMWLWYTHTCVHVCVWSTHANFNWFSAHMNYGLLIWKIPLAQKFSCRHASTRKTILSHGNMPASCQNLSIFLYVLHVSPAAPGKKQKFVSWGVDCTYCCTSSVLDTRTEQRPLSEVQLQVIHQESTSFRSLGPYTDTTVPVTDWLSDNWRGALFRKYVKHSLAVICCTFELTNGHRCKL